MIRPRMKRQGGRGNTDVLVYSLIVLAVFLSGMATWKRYSQRPRSELGDAAEQRTSALLPNTGPLESWVKAGGLPQCPTAAAKCYVCPQCRSSVQTPWAGGQPACPFCGLPMAGQGLERNPARVALARGAGAEIRAPAPFTAAMGDAASPSVVSASAVRPHVDRGACTKCHTVLGIGTAALSPIGGRKTPGALGQPAAAPAVTADYVKPALVREFGMEIAPIPGGLSVTGVMGNSFAARGGVTAGDVVIEYNGARVSGLAQFLQDVGKAIPESYAKIKVLRNGSTKDLSVMVGEGEMEAFRPIPRP